MLVRWELKGVGDLLTSGAMLRRQSRVRLQKEEEEAQSAHIDEV